MPAVRPGAGRAATLGLARPVSLPRWCYTTAAMACSVIRMTNTNLLTETREAIAEEGHSPSDIAFIGSPSSGHACSWAEFEALADIEYQAGFGGAEVATDLVIVFTDGEYLSREESVGSEWWRINRTPTIPTQTQPVHRLVGRCWPTLADLQNDDDKYHVGDRP